MSVKLYFGKAKRVLKHKPLIIIKHKFILDLFHMQQQEFKLTKTGLIYYYNLYMIK